MEYQRQFSKRLTKASDLTAFCLSENGLNTENRHKVTAIFCEQQEIIRDSPLSPSVLSSVGLDGEEDEGRARVAAVREAASCVMMTDNLRLSWLVDWLASHGGVMVLGVVGNGIRVSSPVVMEGGALASDFPVVVRSWLEAREWMGY